MAWIDRFLGQKVGLDTAPLIYFIERNDSYTPRLDPFFKAMNDGQIEVVTSTLTLLEVLVRPLRTGRLDIANQYRRILEQSPSLQVLDVSLAIAAKAAQIRAVHQYGTPDAIQLATSIDSGASHFLTNDQLLKQTSEIEIVQLAE